MLDVGCASGGFFNIMRTLEPSIDYTGVDIAEPPIDLASQRGKDNRTSQRLRTGLERPGCITHSDFGWMADWG